MNNIYDLQDSAMRHIASYSSNIAMCFSFKKLRQAALSVYAQKYKEGCIGTHWHPGGKKLSDREIVFKTLKNAKKNIHPHIWIKFNKELLDLDGIIVFINKLYQDLVKKMYGRVKFNKSDPVSCLETSKMEMSVRTEVFNEPLTLQDIDEESDLDLIRKVRFLDLSDCGFYLIPTQIRNFESLEVLDVSHNPLIEIPSCALLSLPNLRVLNISHSQISTIPSNIQDLVCLEELSAQYCAIVDMALEIKDLTNLTFLNLDSNQMKSLPNTFGDLPHLEYFLANKNKFVQFPEQLCKIGSLRKISLSNNFISSIPNSIGKLRNLETLSLDNNFIKVIPSTFCMCAMLKSLNLQGNRIVSVPLTLLSVPFLEELNLSGNNIGQLPEHISSLRHLSDLSLSKNFLEQVPEDLKDLKNLKFLDLSYNLLENPPLGLEFVHEVRIEGNPLRKPSCCCIVQ